MNAVCVIGMFIYVYTKFRELNKYKRIQEDSTKATKKFSSGITSSGCIKFKQQEKGNISKLINVLKELESKRKSHLPEE